MVKYTYEALGQLLTETHTKDGVSVVVNSMVYDNYGNIISKNGKQYCYDETWHDLLTCYDGQAIEYDAQGNPVSYFGNILTWEKGRQLKSFGSNTYTYNANGIRTSKKVNGVLHTYTLDGTKILRETWDGNTLVPLYDNEDSVCGILYNRVPYYFIKNLQGDVIAIVDKDAKTVARYSYDAWGAVTNAVTYTELTDGVDIAVINPFRYRGYYYDQQTGLYYLQSRYYDAGVGRFISEDPIETDGLDMLILKWNSFAYCENEPVKRIDPNGCYWYQNYYGFKKTSVGFNLYANIAFLSRTFCMSYAYDFLRANGTWHWYGRTYSGMGQLRIAQELWFHAVVYYIGMPLQKVLKAVGISWGWLDSKVANAYYMEINSNDTRAWVFSAFWWAAFVIKTAICRKLSVPYRIIAAIVL